MPKRQVVLMSSSTGGEMKPLGSRPEIREALARFNTAPDGAPRSAASGTEVFHGPGLIIELPSATDTVTQAMVTMTEDEIAFPVLRRLCAMNKWKMVDLETGRSFG